MAKLEPKLNPIETMIVVVIIGILAAIFIPNYLSFRDRHRESVVKHNAYLAQVWVEEQAKANYGVYPEGIADHMIGQPGASNPFGGNAYVDCKLGELPGDALGVCYYEHGSTPGFWYRITVNGGQGTLIEVLTSGDPE